MARIHYFSFIVDDNGHPLPGANVNIFLAGSETPARIFDAEFGGVVNNTAPQLLTNSKGYFEFWISDMENPAGYPYGQKFKIQWSKTGVSEGYIDWIDIFPNIYPVDVNNANGKAVNKLVSDKLAHGWEAHKNHNVNTDFFPIHGLEAFNPDGDINTIQGTFTPEHNEINKIISDRFAYTWDNHSKFSFNDMVSMTSDSSATSAASAEFGSNPDIYNNTAHDLQPVQFNHNDPYYNKLVSNEFMSNFVSRDGIQSFTHPVSGMHPTNPNHLVTKEYIDIINESSFIKDTYKKSFIIDTKDWTPKQDNQYYYIINHGFNEEYPNVIVWDDDSITDNYQITSLNHQQFIIYTNEKKKLTVIVDNNIADEINTSQRKFSINDFELLDDKYFITLYYYTEQQYPFVQVWDYDTKTIHTNNVIYKNPAEPNKLTIRFDSPIECIVNVNNILNSNNRKTIIKDVEQNNMLYFDITSWNYDGSVYSFIVNHNTGKLYPSINTWNMNNESIESLNIESIDSNTLKIYSEEDINIKLTIDDGEYNNFQITENQWIYNSWGEYYYTLLRHDLNTLYTNITTWNVDLNKTEYISDIIVLDYDTILLKSDTPFNLSINIQYPEYSENIRDIHWIQNNPESYEYIVHHNKNIQYPFVSVWNSFSKKEEIELIKNIIYIDENTIKLESFEPLNSIINVSNGYTTPIYEYDHNQPNDTISIISDDWTFSNNIYSKEIEHNLNNINPHLYTWDIDLNRIVNIFNIKNIDNNNIIIYSLQPNNLLVSFENNFGDFHNYFNYIMNNKIDKRGDQMSGILDMTGNIISHLPLPEYPDHAVNKLYVDTLLSDSNNIIFDILGITDSYTPDASANYIDTANSLFNADQILDNQIKTHNDIINILSNNISDTQNDLLNIQNGIGFDSYTPDTSANYINTANSLYEADQILDNEIKNLYDYINTDIVDIITSESGILEEINNIQNGAGLDPSGEYLTPVNAGSFLLSTWNINTDINNTNIIFSVYDINNIIIYPKDIELSNNNLILHFETSINGTCNITETDYNQSFTNQSVWTINHSLDTTNIIFSVYDNDDNIIYPKDIVFVDNNNLTLYFETNVSGKCVISKTDNSYNITDQSTWTINHALDTTNIIFSVYDNDDNIIYPERMEIDNDNLILYFENNISGKCVIDIADEVFNITNSYYLGDSISLYNADLLLDEQIKINSDNIDYLLQSSKSITINTTDWIFVSGGMYEAYVIHNLNDEYPNITIWNTDINKIEKMADIISVNDQYFKISSELPLNLLVKASR